MDLVSQLPEQSDLLTVNDILSILSELSECLPPPHHFENHLVPEEAAKDNVSGEGRSSSAARASRSPWLSTVWLRKLLSGSNPINGERLIRSTSATTSTNNEISDNKIVRSRTSLGIPESQIPQTAVSNYNDSHPLHKLHSDVYRTIKAFNKLKEFEHNVASHAMNLRQRLQVVIEKVKKKPDLIRLDYIQLELRKISEDLNLKCQVPRLPNKLTATSTYNASHFQNQNIAAVGESCDIPSLHMDPNFLNEVTFKEIFGKFNELNINEKLCLLCFAVFHENAVVKKRVLMYWWIAERFIKPDNAEDDANQILKEFMSKGLVEAKLKSNTITMTPLVRSAVIILAKDSEFIDCYDDKGKLRIKVSGWQKAFLVENSLKQIEVDNSIMDLEKRMDLEVLFNISERFPDFTFKWLANMTRLKVLYLGRWESTAERHIEVESTVLMNELKLLKELKLLSFQGISRIEKLPEAICKLPNLTILDLRACYNLEELPEMIGWLKSLIYLDISECYLLDHMPKKLRSLTKLQVFKGFVISDSEERKTCLLGDLAKALKNLRILSISIIKENFKIAELENSFQHLHKLKALKVTWGGIFSGDMDTTKKGMDATTSTTTHVANTIDSKEEEERTKEKKNNATTSTTSKQDDIVHSKKEEGQIKQLDKGKKPMTMLQNKEGANKQMKNDIQGIVEASSSRSATINQTKEETKVAEVVHIDKDKKKVSFGPDKKKDNSKKQPTRTIRQLSRSFSRMPSIRKAHLPLILEKLELQCYPDAEPPSWLRPENLCESLKKLHIKGGKLGRLGYAEGENNNEIEVLRLKYLKDLKLEWRELKSLFPRLKMLEKFKCPKVTFCPCDGNGLWRKCEVIRSQDM